MPRKINIFMRAEPVGNLEKLRSTEHDVFLRGGETSVVSHDSSDIPKTEQQICFFQKHCLMPLLDRPNCRRAAGPACSRYNNFAH